MSHAVHFKDRLHHRIPDWISDGAIFHLRIRCHHQHFTYTPLIGPSLAHAFLDSVRFYHGQRRWYCFIFLLMPDHLHALVMFPREEAMSIVVHDWKRWHTRQQGVKWQDGYFDHRIRSDHEFELKADYIRQNPVVKQLCASAKDWPWLCEPARESESP